jgi:hypothetical protein
MKIDIMYYVFLGFIIIGLCLGFPAGRCSKVCPECPEIQPISTQTNDTVIKHPVATSSSDAQNVKVVFKSHISYKTIVIHDTIEKVVPIIDSSACWYGSEQLSSGDMVNWSMCSALLPARAPVDLQRNFELIRRPDTLHTTTITQSITLPPKKWYIGIGPYIGGGVDIFGRPNAQAGIGIQFGRSIKQF